MSKTDNIDFYNILKKIPSGFRSRAISKPGARLSEDELIELLMNGDVKAALGLDVVWGAQSGAVFDTLAGDFMKPCTEIGKFQIFLLIIDYAFLYIYTYINVALIQNNKHIILSRGTFGHNQRQS